jgi:hypothetical protein
MRKSTSMARSGSAHGMENLFNLSFCSLLLVVKCLESLQISQEGKSLGLMCESTLIVMIDREYPGLLRCLYTPRLVN